MRASRRSSHHSERSRSERRSRLTLRPHIRNELRARLEQLRIWYSANKTPHVLWFAYQTCRELSITPPEWVLRGFDDVVDRLDKAVFERESLLPGKHLHWTSVAAWVMGFDISKKGGRADPFVPELVTRTPTGFDIAQRIRVHIDGPEHQNQTDAIYLVRERFRSLGIKVSEAGARRAWKRYQRDVRLYSLEQTTADVTESDELYEMPVPPLPVTNVQRW
jgi:hypothetical protein